MTRKRFARAVHLRAAGGKKPYGSGANFPSRPGQWDSPPKRDPAGGNWPRSQPGAGWPKPLNKSDLASESPPERDPLFESLLDPEPTHKRNKPKTSKKPVVDKLQESKQKYYFESAQPAAGEYDVFAHLLENETLSKYAAQAEVEWFDAKRLEAESKTMTMFPPAGVIQELLYDSLIDTEGKRWRETVTPSNIRILLVLLQVSELDVEYARYLEYFHTSLTLTPADGIHLVAVSREKPSSNRKISRKLNLRFPLLSDEQGALSGLFGTANKPHLLIFYRERTPSGIEGWYFDRCARAEIPSKLMDNALAYARQLMEQRQSAKTTSLKSAGPNRASATMSSSGTAPSAQQGAPGSPSGPSATAPYTAASEPPTTGATRPRMSEKDAKTFEGLPSPKPGPTQPQQATRGSINETVKQSMATPRTLSPKETPKRDAYVPRNVAKGRLVLNHSTNLEGLVPVLERLANNDLIRKIVPGRLYPARSNAERLSIRVTVPVAGGWKLVARKGTQVQDVFITLDGVSAAGSSGSNRVSHQPSSSLTKEQLEQLIEEAITG